MKKIRLISNLVLIAFFILAYIVNPSNLNPIYANGAFSVLFIISAFVLVNLFISIPGLKLNKEPDGQIKVEGIPKTGNFKKVLITLGALWAVYFLVNVVSAPLFNFWAYRDQLGDMVVTEFSDDVQLIDLSQVPIVDQDLAKTLADKKLGENAGLGSQVYVGEPVIQQINGELVWVVPLQHSGFFKWLNNLSGSRGYIIVSATNLQDIEYVDCAIKYQPNSFFFDDIDRYLRVIKGFIFTGMTDYSFEIDDDGTPHWIITTYSNKWLFALPEATGIITLNATTGETNEYSIDEVPDWVDRVQPEDFITTQLNNQGEYVHGVFNFSNSDKFMTSTETAIIYNEGNCYLFTGLTSVGADESAIGFTMVDMVTKESKIYQISGATETAAMESAEGTVQQYGYTATSPIIINHNGVPTYFITLKDNSGLIKQYAFVSVSDVTSVGASDTISGAIAAYNTVLGSTSSFVVGDGDIVTFTGTVIRIASESLDTGFYYKLILDGKEDKILIASSTISDELALTIEGDEVEISYYETDDGVIELVSFDNKEFTQ